MQCHWVIPGVYDTQLLCNELRDDLRDGLVLLHPQVACGDHVDDSAGLSLARKGDQLVRNHDDGDLLCNVQTE